MGRALAHEARNKGAHCVLGPTVCMHRHPLGGRNFESYSEDPFLTGKLSSQVIMGLQENGVSATIKHFVANEQETQRTSVDETISMRALREIYLRPFEIAVKEAQPWAIMTAYNLINGVHCDGNPWLLQKVLQEEWGWQGLVMSDWGGTNSVGDAIKAGMDIEMPGPPRVRMTQAVLDALEKGDIAEADIIRRAREVLVWIAKLKALEKPSSSYLSDLPEHRALIREAGAKGIVLLKNEQNILPLTKDKIKGKKIALIGYAKDALAHGGGSAAVNSYYKITPFDGLTKALGDAVELQHAKGYHRERLLPPLSDNRGCGSVVGLDGNPGFTRLLFEDTQADPTSTLHGTPASAYSPLGSQESLWRTLEIVGDFTPTETGRHYIACSGLGPTRVWVDDELVFEQAGNCSDPMGSLFLASPEPEIRHNFIAGEKRRVTIRSDPPRAIGLDILEGRSGVRVGFSLESEHDADMLSEAVAVAKDADVAIIFTGHDQQYETEGRDQDSFHLPCGQDAVVKAVARANENTIVVNSTGVAIGMPWLADVKGVLQAWFPGQECGNSIADVLTGAVCPEGRLPTTFPSSLESTSAYGNFPGEYEDGRLKVDYVEGVFIGYRHFDRSLSKEVNFPFGFGLSYTKFEYADFSVRQISGETQEIVVSMHLSNSGCFDGGELVQVYAGSASEREEHPRKQLVAFSKAHLQARSSQRIELAFSVRDLAYWDEGKYRWIVDGGEYLVSLAASAARIIHSTSICVEAMSWHP